MFECVIYDNDGKLLNYTCITCVEGIDTCLWKTNIIVDRQVTQTYKFICGAKLECDEYAYGTFHAPFATNTHIKYFHLDF